MHRVLTSIVLCLVALLQGPALTYAATVGSIDSGDSLLRVCNGKVVQDDKICDACCSHGSMPSCMVQGSVPTGPTVPPALAASLRIAIDPVIIPDGGAAAFAEYTPPHPLRPPIV